MIKIALIHPDIPQNTGNVGRLCVGLNAELHLVRPMGFPLDDAKIRRAGLDYWKDVRLTVHDDAAAFFHFTKGVNLYFLTTKANKHYTDVKFQDGDCLVFGSESKGLPAEILKQHWDHAITIPMFGPIRSLNLATSVGIVAYEAVRQIRRDVV